MRPPPPESTFYVKSSPGPRVPGQSLPKRVLALRTVWDLRWHGENRAIATHSRDPQVSACPICHRFWSQAHVLCDCPATTSARTGGSLDLLIDFPNQPARMARRWAGQLDQTAMEALRPVIASCTRKQSKAVLGRIDRLTSSTAAAYCTTSWLWRASSPPPPLTPPSHNP